MSIPYPQLYININVYVMDGESEFSSFAEVFRVTLYEERATILQMPCKIMCGAFTFCGKKHVTQPLITILEMIL